MPIMHVARKSINAKDLKLLSKRQWWPWVRDISLDYFVIGLAFGLVGFYPSFLTVVAAIFVIGNRQHALALLGHDGTHFTISYNRKINDFLTNFLAWIPLGLTLAGYRHLHGFHHKHLGTENDPEVVYKHSKVEDWELPSSPWKVLKMAALDLIGFGISDYKVIFTYSAPPNKADLIPLALCHILFLASSMAVGLWWVPVVWYYSLVTSFMMFFRLRLWLEHQGTDHAHRLHLNKVEGMLLAPHLSWHHWEHHFWPSIPYYNLPALRKLVPEEQIITLRNLLSFYRVASVISPGAKMT